MKGSVFRDNSQDLLELKAVIANFIRDIPPIELSCVYENKLRRVDTIQPARGVHFQHFFATYVSRRSVSVLMHRDSVNILIVYGRYTGNFGSFCTKYLYIATNTNILRYTNSV